MNIEINPVGVGDVKPMRELYRNEARCQIVHDSVLPRGLADPYLLLVDGRPAGYAGVWNAYHPGRLMEFFTLPRHRPVAPALFRAVLAASRATHVEAQTNMPLMAAMLREYATNIVEEKTLFEDAFAPDLVCPAGTFRRARPGDVGPEGEWVLEVDGTIVAAGGIMRHYNPPHGDLYMEVAEHARRRGFGSYLLQELKRTCHELGLIPAARCDPSNLASRRTLEQAGFVTCGQLLVGEVRRT